MNDTNYERQLPVLIGDIYRNWREALDSIARSYQLTRTEWHILSKLECRGPKLQQQELLEMTGINNAQLTRALNKLEDNHFINRLIDKKNRRIRYIELVNPNADYIQEMLKINSKINNLILNELSSKEQNQLIDLLSRVSKITNDIQKETP